MRIGINGTGLVQQASIDRITEHGLQAETDGFHSYWLAEHPTGGFDALTALAVMGQRVKRLELGTAVIPTFPRHPMQLAAQALTTRTAIGDRLTLGIGLSHKVMMNQLGFDFQKPIRHLREFLSILIPLLNHGEVSFQGESLICKAKIFMDVQTPVSLVVAALGTQALRVTGARTDGTTLAWVGPKTIKGHIVPRLADAAARAGRKSPRVIATLPVCVTSDPDSIRAKINRNLGMYAELPSYKAMFDLEGAHEPGDLAIVGSADEVTDQIHRLAEAGVTDFAASEFTPGEQEKIATRELLKSLLDKV